jgi:hypothetical protein
MKGGGSCLNWDSVPVFAWTDSVRITGVQVHVILLTDPLIRDAIPNNINKWKVWKSGWKECHNCLALLRSWAGMLDGKVVGIFEVRGDVPKKTDLSWNVLLTQFRVRVRTGEQIFKSLIYSTKGTKVVCRSECKTKIVCFKNVWLCLIRRLNTDRFLRHWITF